MNVVAPGNIISTELWGTVSDIVVAICALVTTGSVIFLGVQIRLQRTQLHRDLENLYVERFWQILDRLEESEPGSPERKRAVKGYLSLSEDQCDLRAQGRVTNDTWKVWGPSIFQQINEPEFMLEIEQAPVNSFKQLREMLTTGKDYDPSALTPGQRKKLGL